MNTNLARKISRIYAAGAEQFSCSIMNEYLTNRVVGKGVFDSSDSEAQFILACDEECCAGGMRIHISNRCGEMLPVEQKINVRHLFAGCLPSGVHCAELSRLYINPDCDSVLSVLTHLLQAAFHQFSNRHISHVFALIRENELALYQQVSAVMGCAIHHRPVQQDFVPASLQDIVNHKTIQVICLEKR